MVSYCKNYCAKILNPFSPSLAPSLPPSLALAGRYYAFDEAFVREVLGKKLSKGTKKDLDDVSAKTGITLKSCRRQFDNFKRVFKVVEEMKGPLVENIHQNFLLSDRLASMVEDMDVDLDKEFLQDLKDLKVLITDKDMMDQHKSLVCTALRGKLQVFSEMEGSFKNLSRGLVNIAGKLMNNKDVRDLFIDLVEKFIEPCKSDKWSLNDVRLFLTQHTNSVRALDAFK
ncbi:Acidic fibroblast growth factor intracellular-binding protein [Acipenser ruthenus]|uniref:Acidic fibroblast growth factor intracellular-binding protein n=1 Tax=Acipenser ruthenus TaxID=7906 RepID=A0A444UU73_ACIRT|nr:Acidic fibroblast growth factor intracellular-binding protein [Acipenser ruthenus]